MSRKHGFWLAAVIASLSMGRVTPSSAGDIIRTRQSGAWSSPTTWEGNVLPAEGSRVQIREGHAVVYDRNSDRPIRSVHVAGSLRFATDRDTRLDVGLIKLQAGEDASENGFDCDAHVAAESSHRPRPALEVGSAESPIARNHSATIRLVVFDGMDAETCPAIVSCGGRMDFHGASMPRTWVKLGENANSGDTSVVLAEPVPGWRVGDQLIVTATRRERKEGVSLRPGAGTIPRFTEKRRIAAIDGTKIRLDQPLNQLHAGTGEFRGEVANLSRNVVIESADPAKGRGHTMFHRNSTGSIAYAEFRHLGKEGVKGRYPIHFHLAGETMRGSSVVGASIWDSGNRWVTVHGTNHLIVRDCVGYQAVGHGFFLEDGTETLNVLDHNLAVQAFAGKPLPDQSMASDDNAGAGFWWANSLSTFTRNVATECDRYGFRYQASPADNLRLKVLMPNGQRDSVDIRTLPFVRFEDNEAHAQLYGFNLGEGTEGVDPDRDHPFVVRNTRLWDNLWAFRPEVPVVVVEGMTIERAKYGVFHAVGEHHSYRRLKIRLTFMAGARPTPDEPDVDTRVLRDDMPPTTVITFFGEESGGKRLVRGCSTDNGVIKRVLVNGLEAKALVADFSQWEAVVDDPRDGVLTAHSEDVAGNIESQPHVLKTK